jgi:fatty-acyl-CoA synthase
MTAADTYASQRTYAEMFRDTAMRRPEVEALVFPGKRVTYQELLARGELRACQLRQLGVGPRKRFGLLMENCPEIVEFLLGAAFIGATAVPINTRFRPLELAHVIADAELTSVATTGAIDGVVEFTDLLAAALPSLAASEDLQALSLTDFPHLQTVATSGERAAAGIIRTRDIEPAVVTEATPESTVSPDDPLLIMYTSGTTANPKGCVLTNGALVHNSWAIVDRLEVTESDRWWDPLPMFHMGGIMLMSSVFAAGGTFISQAHFTSREALELIGVERPTVLYPLFPTISLDIIHDPGFTSVDTDHVRMIGSVAPPDVQERIQAAFPDARLISAYGITELCGCVAFHSPHDPADDRLSGCGCPMDGFEMRIVDPDTNQPLPAGERGELVGRGTQMFSGYYGDPAATAEVIDAEGFFHTGDLCSTNERAAIFYHGRIKDMLKVGGENVSAIEVESYLATHPAIKMAQVVGVPDSRLLEAPAAFIELVPGQSLSGDEVIAYCRGRIAGFKVPRHVRFVTEWPMSATKVQKFRLRDQLAAELSDEPALAGSRAGAPAAGTDHGHK